MSQDYHHHTSLYIIINRHTSSYIIIHNHDRPAALVEVSYAVQVTSPTGPQREETGDHGHDDHHNEDDSQDDHDDDDDENKKKFLEKEPQPAGDARSARWK